MIGEATADIGTANSANMQAMMAENRAMQNESLMVQAGLAKDKAKFDAEKSIIDQAAAVSESVQQLAAQIAQQIAN